MRSRRIFAASWPIWALALSGCARNYEPEPSLPVRRADGATGDHRLSPAGGEPDRIGPLDRTAEEQLERDIVATQQALQLDALIDWVEQQTAIDPNAGPD